MTSQQMVTQTIRDEARRRGLNQSALARLLGVDRSTVANKLLGRRLWSLEDLDRLSSALGIPPAWFLMARDTAATRW